VLTHVTVLGEFVHVAAGCTDADGEAVDPSAAVAKFFRVSQSDGSLFPDPNIGSNGVLTLAKEGDETGFWGAALEVAGLEAGQFVVLFRATIGGTETVGVDYLEVGEDPHLRECAANAVYANSSDTMTVNAWLVDHGRVVSDAAECLFTLFDDAGEEVLAEPLVSDAADENGVFRLTAEGPGLCHDRSYYGKVAVSDGLRTYSGLVGLVTVE